jgi:ABC-type multidrug transport system fused ATPase/permease subunit
VILLFIYLADLRVGLLLTLYLLFATFVLLRIQGLAVPHFRASRVAVAKLSSFWEETLAMLEDIRGVGALRYVAQQHGIHLRELLQRGRRAQVMFRAFVGTFAVVFAVGNAIAFVAGAWLYFQNAMSIGTVYLMMYYTTLMTWALGRMAEQVNDFQQATTAIGRIQELTTTQSALVSGSHLLESAQPPTLDFCQVNFGYQVDAPVLQEITFRLEAGEVLGIVGRTGGGKSTLARLLFRFYDPVTGAILLDGIDLRHFQLESLRANIGFVTQDVQLFHASVRDNLILFDHAVADQAIVATLHEVGLSGWLQGLEHGLDTRLAGNQALSAGEAQLLAFARVLLKDPRIVVLDEPTSRLDPVTETLIERAVTRLLAGRTALLIAHRLHTLHRADKILVLEGGRIVEFGQRTDLLADPASHFAALLRHSTFASEKTEEGNQ